MKTHTQLFQIVLAVWAVTSGLTTSTVGAQPYPNKVIQVINPASPGGNSDILFRLLFGKVGEILGQQLVVDYRPGAGGRVGSELTARSTPDGYTVITIWTSDFKSEFEIVNFCFLKILLHR